ncbi:TPA_asm: hypothetical protein [Hydra MELD virus]|nr:TPA_asm: hypothetical protein [Hydra MELD virus]
MNNASIITVDRLWNLRLVNNRRKFYKELVMNNLNIASEIKMFENNILCVWQFCFRYPDTFVIVEKYNSDILKLSLNFPGHPFEILYVNKFHFLRTVKTMSVFLLLKHVSYEKMFSILF